MRSSLFRHVKRRRLLYANVSGQPIGSPSRKVSNITANLCRVTCQKSEHLEVPSLVIIDGPSVVDYLGRGTDRLSTSQTLVLSGEDSTASNFGHFNPLEINAGRI